MAELVERWPAAVGADIARFAWPARIGRDGTVHVNTADSVWAFELGHRSAEIAARAGVAKLRFAPGPLPAAAPAADAPERVVPSPEDEERAAALAARIEDEKLRESVQKAIAFSLARGSATRPV
jgi:Dna[CI] antecedent, DciA